MSLAIFIFLIGIPIGLFMLLQPRRMWWLFESWKFRNPEANEPSDASYLMTSLGGLAVLVVVVFSGAMMWSADNDHENLIAQQEADKQAREQEKIDRQRAIDTYVAPPAENRGLLPFVGYRVVDTPDGRQFYELWYLRPPLIYPSRIGRLNCVTRVRIDEKATPALASGNLSWEPTRPPREYESGNCVLGSLAVNAELEWQRVLAGATLTEIVTDSAIVDPDGTVLAPAKPGNMLPRLDAEPKR